MVQEMFTPEEIAAKLKVKKRTVYSWLQTGKLKGVKLGDLWRCTEQDIQDFLDQSRKHTGQEENG